MSEKFNYLERLKEIIESMNAISKMVDDLGYKNEHKSILENLLLCAPLCAELELNRYAEANVAEYVKKYTRLRISLHKISQEILSVKRIYFEKHLKKENEKSLKFMMLRKIGASLSSTKVKVETLRDDTFYNGMSIKRKYDKK